MVDMHPARRARRETRGGVPGWIDEETRRWAPIMAGAEEDDGDDGRGGDGGDGDAGRGGDESGSPAAGGGDGVDWKRESRKHESRAKQSAREAAELRERLDALEAQGKTDQERAVDEARRAGREEALTESQKERRADRLESAVMRHAAKGVKVGDGDDARTVKFDDPEDALVFIERAISRGEIPEADIFDDAGKVKADGLVDALADLAKRKPSLVGGAAADAGTRRRVEGDADGGKGSGSATTDPAEMTPEQHRARRRKEREGR